MGAGDALDKLKGTLTDGILYPSGILNDPIEELSSKVFEHALYHGEKGVINIENYIQKHKDDERFSNSREIREYPTIKDALKRFKLDNISLNPTSEGRKYTNWVSSDEDETKDSYGEEFYFEFDLPKKSLIQGSHGYMVPKPINLGHAKKLVIGGKYISKVEEIKNTLKQQGYKDLKIEVNRGKHSWLENRLLNVLLFSSTLLIVYLIKPVNVTGAIIGGTSAMSYIVILIALSFVALFFSLKMLKKKKSLKY